MVKIYQTLGDIDDARYPQAKTLKHWADLKMKEEFKDNLDGAIRSMSKFEVTNSRISSSVPGSWLPNWLHGNPSTTRSSLSWWRVRRPAYWGVRPQALATLTTRASLPL